jgi:hypothetical protein
MGFLAEPRVSNDAFELDVARKGQTDSGGKDIDDGASETRFGTNTPVNKNPGYESPYERDVGHSQK